MGEYNELKQLQNMELYTPEFIKCFCYLKGITIKDFYKSFGFNFGYPYFTKVLNYKKPMNDKFKIEVALCFNELYKISTDEIIKVAKLRELLSKNF